MRRKPAAQHRRLVVRQRAATQPAADRGRASRSLAHRIAPARAARVHSGRRTCRLPAPAGRARRSSRRRTAASANRPRLRPSSPSATAAARVASRYSAGPPREERPQRQVASAPPAASGAARTRARASGASAWAAGSSPGRRSRTCRRTSRRWADARPGPRRSATASAPRPSGRDTPSHRRVRRPRHRPGSGSCRRRSGCSAACPGTRCRAWPSGRCPPARRGTRPARRGRRAAARRWRTWCRRKSPARWRSAPARAAGWCSPRSSAPSSRCWPARCARAAGSASGRRCLRW